MEKGLVATLTKTDMIEGAEAATHDGQIPWNVVLETIICMLLENLVSCHLFNMGSQMSLNELHYENKLIGKKQLT